MLLAVHRTEEKTSGLGASLAFAFLKVAGSNRVAVLRGSSFLAWLFVGSVLKSGAPGSSHQNLLQLLV